MSYDIRFAVKVAGAGDELVVIGEPEYSSPTYNIRDIFVKSMDWNYTQGVFYKLSYVWPKIEHGISELSAHMRDYKQLEPDNGWGSAEGALRCLRSIHDWWIEWSECNPNVPMKCVYMAW